MVIIQLHQVSSVAYLTVVEKRGQIRVLTTICDGSGIWQLKALIHNQLLIPRVMHYRETKKYFQSFKGWSNKEKEDYPAVKNYQ